MKKIISTENAPSAIGPYSQAIEVKNTLYISGQIPVDPATGKVAVGFREQVDQVLKNIGGILQAAGYEYDNVVKCTCMLTDMNNFGIFNEVYEKYFTEEAPARTSFQVSRLPLGVLVEIDCIAVKQ